MSTTDTRFDLYQTVTNRIIELLQRGTIPWQKPWTDSGPPANALSKRQYHGINVWLLLSLSYDVQLYLTWEQLKRLGGSVKRGEKGHLVVYRAMMGNKESETGENEKSKPRFVLRYHVVFNIAQCTNIPEGLCYSSYVRPNDPIAACEEALMNMPDVPLITFAKQQAFYSIDQDCINLPKLSTFKSSQSYYATLFHELIHSTGHEKRLHRKTITEMAEFGSDTYSLEELVAELGASYLCCHAGLTQDINNSAAYIDGWLSKLKNDKRFIISASALAQRATEYILGRKPEEEAPQHN